MVGLVVDDEILQVDLGLDVLDDPPETIIQVERAHVAATSNRPSIPLADIALPTIGFTNSLRTTSGN